jgi:hypothetical protein
MFKVAKTRDDFARTQVEVAGFQNKDERSGDEVE